LCSCKNHSNGERQWGWASILCSRVEIEASSPKNPEFVSSRGRKTHIWSESVIESGLSFLFFGSVLKCRTIRHLVCIFAPRHPSFQPRHYTVTHWVTSVVTASGSAPLNGNSALSATIDSLETNTVCAYACGVYEISDRRFI
jgi:hypothetical protein